MKITGIINIALAMWIKGQAATLDEAINDAINGEAANYDEYNQMWAAVDAWRK